MSWMGEEWKKELSSDASEHVKCLEDSLAKYKNEVTQWQFRFQSLESQFENSKQKCDAQSKEIKAFERRQIDLDVDSEKKKEIIQNLNVTLSKKENLIRDNSDFILKLKENLAICQEEKGKLQVDLKKLNEELENCRIAAKASSSKSSIVENSSKREIEDLKHRLEAEEKSHRQTELAYEGQLKENMEKEKRIIEENDELQKECRSLGLKLNQLEKEKKELMERLNDIEIEMKSENSSDQNVGEYLGIHVRKFKSESQLNVDLQKSQLLKENKNLQEKIEELEREKQPYGNGNNNKLRTQPKTKLSHNVVDSGLVLKDTTIMKHDGILPSIADTENEVILTRIEGTEHEGDSHSTILESNDDIHESDSRQATYFVDVALLESFKEENCKLKEEISQMKDVYENHMRVCSGVALPRKSMEKLSTQNEQLVEEMTKKLHEAEEERHQLVRHLKSQEVKYNEMEKTLRCFTQNNKSVEKLDELVDLIMQKKPSDDNFVSHCDIQQLQDDVTSNVDRLLSRMEENHMVTREFFTNCVSKVFQEQQRNLNNNRSSLSPSCACVINKKVDYQGVNKQTLTRSGSIQDLESMKNQIDNIQQLVQSYEKELKAMERDRGTLQEEIVKLMELVKKRDQRIGQLSCDYEKEKRKAEESDSCFKMEMSALKHEQLQVYQEFRDMCETLKRKDVELLNKSKQIKILSSEIKEKEKIFEEKIEDVEKNISEVGNEKSKLEKELRISLDNNKVLMSRLDHCCDHLQEIHGNLTRIETIFNKLKSHTMHS